MSKQAQRGKMTCPRSHKGLFKPTSRFKILILPLHNKKKGKEREVGKESLRRGHVAFRGSLDNRVTQIILSEPHSVRGTHEAAEYAQGQRDGIP